MLSRPLPGSATQAPNGRVMFTPRSHDLTMTPHPFFPVPARAALFGLALVGTSSAWAQTPAATTSQIAQVTLYPGSAKVERVAKVAAGAKKLTFTCLPSALDASSLAVAGDASVRLGEFSVVVEDRAAVPACAGTELDARIRELEDKKAALAAEDAALGMVTGYLKSETTGGVRQATDPKTLAAMAEALRRTGQDTFSRQHLISRQQQELDRTLAPLVAERARVLAGRGRVSTVSVTLDAPRDAEVRLIYQINGPGWAPSYRASLDTRTNALSLERQAQVAQATGEDWVGVPLRLSTGQPRRGTTGPQPRPWRLSIAEPRAETAGQVRAMAAPAPMMSKSMPTAEADEVTRPSFDVSVFDNAYATEFTVPQRIDVPSGGQRVTVSLGSHNTTATLLTRTTPSASASAWLVAEMAQPDGVWPQGALQLYRDGAYVGSDTLRAGGKGLLSLSFGLDELTVVRVEPQKDRQGSTGFVGSRATRTVARAYTVENRHRTPVQLQVLEAAPVSVDEKVSVETQFSPEPAAMTWNDQAGVAVWRQPLAAGQTARFTADYAISYPKDARLQENR